MLFSFLNCYGLFIQRESIFKLSQPMFHVCMLNNCFNKTRCNFSMYTLIRSPGTRYIPILLSKSGSKKVNFRLSLDKHLSGTSQCIICKIHTSTGFHAQDIAYPVFRIIGTSD
uniref:Pre-mRNA-processing factor 39 isoform X1 n=1 Tax=Rhizophora mucronata TaxID=61149 RepID=A0A2P2MLS2_RHIMU